MTSATCPSCASTNVWTRPGFEETLVGYPRFTDALGPHDHDDNCKTKGYWCADCSHRWRLVLRNRCSNDRCSWTGKTSCRTCRYDESMLVDEFPTAQIEEN